MCYDGGAGELQLQLPGFPVGSKIIQYRKIDGGDQTQVTIPNNIILKSKLYYFHRKQVRNSRCPFHKILPKWRFQ
jgi:hypothetical protein